MHAITISLDAELALGYHDLRDVSQSEVAAARDAWTWLVDRLESAAIPCTWAVPGHLWLAGCDGVHADHPSPADWFAADPGGDESSAPGWFGRRLLRAVEESDVDHEIASHTFSHVPLGRPDVTRAVARAELERCVEVAEQRGHDVDTLVFPRDEVGHLDLLPEYGIDAFRGPPPGRWFDGSPLRPAGKALSYTVGRSAPPVSEPVETDHGPVNVPGSLYLFGFEGVAKRVVTRVSEDPVVRQAERGLDRLAGRSEGVFHLWFHPNNLVAETDFERVDRVLELVERYRERHDVPVLPMRDVAAEVRGGG